MTHPKPGYRAALLFATLGICLSVVGESQAQMKADRLLFTDPGRRFAVEFPKDWKWELIAGAGEPVAVLIHPRSEAAVVVEHLRLPQAMERRDITPAFADSEAAFVREHQPLARQVASTIISEGRPGVVLDYSRTTLAGRERVRQYSFAVGQDLYRLTCMALEGNFTKFEPVLSAIVATLKTAGELPAAPPAR